MAEKLDNRIVELLSRNLGKLYSIADIAKKLNVAYSHAHLFVNKLISFGIIKPQRIGKTIICQLDFKEQLTIAKLIEIEYLKTASWKKKNKHSEKILNKIEQVKEDIEVIISHNNKIIILASNKDADFSIFRNRKVTSIYELRKNKKYYDKAIVLYGAERYWSLIKCLK